MSIHRLTPGLSPKLRVTAKLIQALNLLRLTMPALKEYLDKSISENPLLQPLDPERLRSDIKNLISSSDNSGITRVTAFGEIGDYAENLKSDTVNLHDHLLHQLRTSFLDNDETLIGERIVESLDNNGYLPSSPAELAQRLAVSTENLEKTLNVIQTFDPPGVGARNLQECLLIQLKVKGMERSLAYKIVKSFFKELSRKKLDAISERTAAPIEEVGKALKIITSLNPKPGALFSPDKNAAVVPDIIIKKHKNGLKIALNDKELPKLAINPNYVKLLESKDSSGEVRQFITERLKNAIWLKRAMEERRHNILKVMNNIAKIQKHALLNGFYCLKPLTLTDIAKISGLHHSTVSRIVADKYALTPHGTIKIKDLFSGKYELADGSSISRKSVLLKIRNIVSNGYGKSRLTDREISRVLQKNGIRISRRTVAKYRSMLKIPPSFLR